MTESLSLELTTHCQQNCLHCFARSEGIQFRHMPYETAVDIMEEGASLGYERLHLTGGEVLLYPHFFSILEKAEELGFPFIFINTNGHLLDDEKCRRLSEKKGVEFSLSLNGPRELHDAVRGKGAYDLAMAGLKKACEYKLTVHIFTVVNRKNLETLPHFCSSLFEDLPGLADISFIQLRSGPEGEEEKLRPEDFLSWVKMISLLALTGLPVHILENPLSTVSALHMGHTHLPPSLPISREGKVLIFADGHMGDNHSSSLDLGNYTRGCLPDVFASPPYRKAWVENEETCGSCEFRETCRRGGLLAPSSADHNVLPYDVPFCQKVMSLF